MGCSILLCGFCEPVTGIVTVPRAAILGRYVINVKTQKMDKDQIGKIINNNNLLAETNNKLAEANHKALELVMNALEEKEQLLSVCREIYEGLDDKNQKNLVEQIWHSGLHNILNKKDESSK